MLRPLKYGLTCYCVPLLRAVLQAASDKFTDGAGAGAGAGLGGWTGGRCDICRGG